MDTLFRLANLHSSDHHPHHQHRHQQQESDSFNSSRTSTTASSRSSHYQHHPEPHHNYQGYPSDNSYSYSYYYHPGPQEEVHQPQPYSSSSYLRNSSSQEEVEQDQGCGNTHNQTLFMDEDFSSSSNPNPNPNPTNISSSSYSTPNFSLPQDHLSLNLDFAPGSRWSTDLLLDCSRAVAARDTARVQQLMWALNELSSPYGDTEQKIVHYFLQGLFARLTSSGLRTLRTLSSASDRTASFDSTRRTALRFQELSPWSSFGHVAANGAILESFLDGSSPERLHILDISNTFCTQWPTLLEALATRSADDTPHLTITTVVNSPSAASSSVQRVMKEIGARMEKFARLMGVPFKFNIVYHAGDLSDLDLDRLDCGGGGTAALAVNFVNALHCVSPAGRRRDSFLTAVRRLRPKIVTVVEEEADLDTSGLDEEEGFMKGFRESLKFFSAYFDSLEESFPKTSNERLALERAAGRAVVDLVACAEEDSAERRETAAGWGRRMRAAGMSPARFSDDVADDVRALLRRYREGWSMRPAAEADPTEGIFLAWKEEPVVWASAWRI